MDFSLAGSSIHGIFQASVLEWGAIAFSGKTTHLSLFCLILKNFIVGFVVGIGIIFFLPAPI